VGETLKPILVKNISVKDTKERLTHLKTLGIFLQRLGGPDLVQEETQSLTDVQRKAIEEAAQLAIFDGTVKPKPAPEVKPEVVEEETKQVAADDIPIKPMSEAKDPFADAYPPGQGPSSETENKDVKR